MVSHNKIMSLTFSSAGSCLVMTNNHDG